MSAHFKNALSGVAFSFIRNISGALLAAFIVAASMYLFATYASAAVVTIFSDDFEGSGNLTGWTEASGGWSETGPALFIPNHSGTRAARILGDTGANDDVLRIAASTYGHDQITVEYWYRVTTVLNSNDDFYVEWFDGTNWNVIQHLDGSPITGWKQFTLALPASAANNAGFQLRFRAGFDAPLGLDSVRIDDVLITGNQIENTLTLCTDGADNDADGQTNLADSDCEQFLPKLNVTKVVSGGAASPNAFSFNVTLNGSIGPVKNFDANGNATLTLTATGTYSVAEVASASYNAGYSADCTGTLAAGEMKSCVITNTYVVPPPPSCDMIVDSNTVIQSDAGMQINAGNASVLTPHAGWTTIPGVSWIGETAYDANSTTNAVGTTTYTRSFPIAGTPLPSTLQISADNGYQVWVNGNSVCSDPDGSNYASVDTCSIPASALVSGSNMLKIEVDNHVAPQGYDGPNPAGLTFKMTVTKNACIPAPTTSTVTMCKVDQNNAPLSGWTLTLKGKSIEDVIVSSNSSAGANSIANMLLGTSYIATASGTWTNQGGANQVDAEYSSTSTWATYMDGFDGYSTDILELQINSTFDPNSNWGTYNTSHTYAQSFMGMGSPVNLRIYDGTGGVQNEGWFGDNSGSLNVNIAEGYAGITGQNGCVAFQNVPVGTYTAGEIMQDGWTNVSGLGTVEVNDATETFTIKNSSQPAVQTKDVLMCKVNQNNQPQTGWTLTLTQDEIGSVSVLPDGALHMINNVPAGSYVLTADGKYTYRADAVASTSDATFSYRLPSDSVYGGTYAPWVNVNTFPNPYTGWLGVMMNGSVTNWGSVFNPNHQYVTATTTNATSNFSFQILDDQYSDNSGSINVSVKKGYMGVTTGETGCALIEDVPYGTYTVGEIMQQGWTNVSGLGSVVIDAQHPGTVVVMNDDGAPLACNKNAAKKVVSRAAVQVDGGNAMELVWNHASWMDETTIDPMAKWIWDLDGVNNPTGTETETFTDTFKIVGTPNTDATLTFAADNAYSVMVNNDPVAGCSSNAEVNYTAAVSCTIPMSQLINGANTLSITVTNLAMADGTAETNPAGLVYELDYNENECIDPEPKMLNVHIYKHIKDGNGSVQFVDEATVAPFAMNATWMTANLNGGLASSAGYVLGDNHGGAYLRYAASTSPMQAPADYTTSEVTGGAVLAVDAACVAGKYRLVGYKWGTTLAAAEAAAISTTAPVFTDIISDRHVIVVNELCTETDEDGFVNVYIYKYLKNGQSEAIVSPSSTDTFPMQTTYSIVNGPSGSNVPFSLSNVGYNNPTPFTAKTSDMGIYSDYAVNEVTGGSVLTPGAACEAGKYRLVGYRSGMTLGAAQTAPITTTSPTFNDLISDMHVIVVNEDCDDLNGGGTPNGTIEFVKKTTSSNGEFTFEIDTACVPFPIYMPEIDIPLPCFDMLDMLSPSMMVSTSTVNGWATTSVSIAPGTYDVNEIVPQGWALDSVSCVLNGSATGTAYPNGMTIVLGSGQKITCTFTNTPTGGETTSASTVVVSPSAMNGWDLLNYDDATANDTAASATTTSGTGGYFTLGPVGQPLGNGSFKQVTGTNGNDATRLRTSQFNGVPLANIKSLSYDTFVTANGGAQAPYVQIRIDRDANGVWDDALFFEPVYQNGTYSMLYGQPAIANQCGMNPNCVSLGIWQSWNGYTGGWWTNLDSAGGPPLTTLEKYAMQYPNAVLATDTQSVRVQAGFGAPVWNNFDGNFDKFVIAVKTGSNTHTTTFDFEPATQNNNGGGGEGGNGGGQPNPPAGNGMPAGGFSSGSVLGASTSLPELPAGCDALLHTYMRFGKKNDAAEVKLLQKFLNDHVGTNLPISGFFGPMTHNAVKKFQAQHAAEVLTPWGLTAPTGFVYLTTQRWINLIHCSTLNIPMPTLVPASQNPEV